MKKTALLMGLIVTTGLLFSGCTQLDQLKQKTVGTVEKTQTKNAEVTKKTSVTTDGDVVKQTEVEIKKPADVDKVVKEVDQALNDLNDDDLNLDL